MDLYFASCLTSFASVALIMGVEILTGWSKPFASIRRCSLWIQIPLFVVVQAAACHLFLLLAWLLFWSPDLPTTQDHLKLTLTVLVGPMALAVFCQVSGFLLLASLLRRRSAERVRAAAR